MKAIAIFIIFLLFIQFRIESNAQNASIPFTVDSLFDQNNSCSLGLDFAIGVETHTIFSPKTNDNKYNHGAVLYPFKEMLYAQWQSSALDEDSDNTHIFFSRSIDGVNWCAPIKLTDTSDEYITTSGGWWSKADSLIAFICKWPNNQHRPKHGFTEFMLSTDGVKWTKANPVSNSKGKAIKGIIEQDIHQLANGRLITAFHMQPGLIVKPYYTDDPLGITGWTQGKMNNLPSKNKYISRELEPSVFIQKDGAIVMIFRDQQSSFKKLASISFDNGENWSKPVIIDTPDSRAKQSAGNLPDGTAYMINNPTGNKNRFPLVVTLSKDGCHFNKAFLIRSGGNDLQRMRYEGKYKRPGYSYPKSVVWGDYLYISYATNKEDVEISRIPLESITNIP